MQDTIVNYLKNTYQPVAIVLHGSRARGKERAHSDWDFILLYTEPTDVGNGRELFQDQNIEYTVHTLPVSDIIDEFGGKLQGATVLYEQENEGTTLLQAANTYYAQGVHWTKEKIANHKLWVEGRINGMKDNVDDPIIFNKYFADFYGRVFNYWYWVLMQQHSQPIYIATEEVAKKDSDYYELVSALVDSTHSLEEKVVIAEKIYQRLFNS